TVQRLEEHLVDAKGTAVPFPVTDENGLRVACPRDVSARRGDLACHSPEFRHREDAVAVPDEGDAVSIRGPRGAALRVGSGRQLPKRLTRDGFYIDIRR